MVFRNKLRVVLPAMLRSRFIYVWSIRTIQLCLFIVSTITAFLLRFEFSIPETMITALLACLWVGVAAKVAVFHGFGLGRGMWRYFSTQDLVRVAATNAGASAVTSAILLAAGPKTFPRSVLIIDFLLTLLLTVGARAGTRFALEVASRAQGKRAMPGRYLWSRGGRFVVVERGTIQRKIRSPDLRIH